MPSKTADKPAVDLKTALETFAGHKIDASPEQVEQQIRLTPFPFSNYSFTPAGTGQNQENVGQVVSRSIVVIIPPSCSTAELLDVSGVAATSATGTATLLIRNFICPAEAGRFYGEPVITVATPASAQPSFLTITHSLVVNPPFTSPTDVQINVFSWDANGAPAPNVLFNFRCRVPAFPIIL